MATRNFLAETMEGLEKLIQPPPPINHSTSIVRLYVASDKLLNEGQRYFTEGDLERCYILWMRFVRYILEQLVRHKDYYSEEIAEIRKEYRTKCGEVLDKLENVKTDLKLLYEKRKRADEEAEKLRLEERQSAELLRQQERERAQFQPPPVDPLAFKSHLMSSTKSTFNTSSFSLPAMPIPQNLPTPEFSTLRRISGGDSTLNTIPTIPSSFVQSPPQHAIPSLRPDQEETVIVNPVIVTEEVPGPRPASHINPQPPVSPETHIPKLPLAETPTKAVSSQIALEPKRDVKVEHSDGPGLIPLFGVIQPTILAEESVEYSEAAPLPIPANVSADTLPATSPKPNPINIQQPLKLPDSLKQPQQTKSEPSKVVPPQPSSVPKPSPIQIKEPPKTAEGTQDSPKLQRPQQPAQQSPPVQPQKQKTPTTSPKTTSDPKPNPIKLQRPSDIRVPPGAPMGGRGAPVPSTKSVAPPSYQSVVFSPAMEFTNLTNGFRISGIDNLGNTCWMNSILQCLSSTVPLSYFFLSRKYKDHVMIKKSFVEFYYTLMTHLWKGYRQFMPVEFLSRFRDRAPRHLAEYNVQQDAHEGLTYLLDFLHEGLNKAISNSYHESGPESSRGALLQHKRHDDSFIWDLFGGQLQSKITCTSCGRSSMTYDHFTSLSLEIGNNSTDIHDVLQLFTTSERIEWNCPSCSTVSTTQRKLSISKLPQILIVHLKRFRQTITGSSSKISSLVTFPFTNLNLESYISHRNLNPVKSYNLYAVCSGTLSGGHYTATVKKDEAWWNCNDSMVTPITNPASIVSSTAYLLFYHRKDLNM